MINPNDIADFFSQNGYYLAKKVFEGDELATLEQDYDHIVHQLVHSGEEINATWGGPEMERLQTQNLKVLHTHNVQQYSANWLRAMMSPKFLHVATALLGPDVILHHSKLFYKPSEEGAPFPMHQDWEYFPTLKDTMLAGIVHISEGTDAMGCLRVYPGTHKFGRIQGTNGNAESEFLSKYPLEKAVPLEAEPGDVLFFHYFLVHGSMPNRSPKPRKTVLVQLHSGDDDVEPWVNHPNERLALAGWNSMAKRSLANT